MTPLVCYTVGHSNQTIDELLHLVQTVPIAAVLDVRRFPGSKRFPHFRKEALDGSLSARGLVYEWWGKPLGGYRKATLPASESPNTGLADESFRAYADYLLTDAGQEALTELIRFLGQLPAALLCAERVPDRCHRRLLADHLVARGVEVLHLIARDEVRPHVVEPPALVEGERVTYPGGMAPPAPPTAPRQQTLF